MEFRLLVIRTSEIKKLVEIYPLAKDQTEADKELRLGFALDDFENTITILRDKAVEFVSEPMQTDYGFMAIIKDPDGRRVELYKK